MDMKEKYPVIAVKLDLIVILKLYVSCNSVNNLLSHILSREFSVSTIRKGLDIGKIKSVS